MVADAYGTILEELSKVLKIGKLTPDSNNSCLIRLENGCEVQIEPDKSGENLIIGSKIASIPPGGYRINVFKEALKANNLPLPKAGIFAWSKKADQLVIYTVVRMRNLTGDKVGDLIFPLTATAIKWGEAIKAGQVPHVEVNAKGGATSSGIFGLMR